MSKYKLAILTAHPIQYQAPLFRKLSENPKIDLTVILIGILELISQVMTAVSAKK